MSSFSFLNQCFFVLVPVKVYVFVIIVFLWQYHFITFLLILKPHRLGGRRVRVQGEPTGSGRAGRPRKYSPVGREGIGTSTVVRGKGEGGRGRRETGTTEIGGQSSVHQQARYPGDDW